VPQRIRPAVVTVVPVASMAARTAAPVVVLWGAEKTSRLRSSRGDTRIGVLPGRARLLLLMTPCDWTIDNLGQARPASVTAYTKISIGARAGGLRSTRGRWPVTCPAASAWLGASST
jgi:hypothetical protein